MIDIDPKVMEQLRSTYEQLKNDGKLLSRAKLEQQYTTFQARFGKEWLTSRDGETLLNEMQDITSYDSLVYWLEFKKDDEFDTRVLGSIRGGSSLKYLVYRRKESGEWAKGKGNNPVEISVSEAIEIARSNREQLLRGIELIEQLPDNPTQDDYNALQERMNNELEISRLGWVHKYFSLLFPEKLFDYHSASYGRYHIIKLLQIPSPIGGQYAYAYPLLQTAKALDLPVNSLSQTMNTLHGDPRTYWRIGTRGKGGEGDSQWETMLNHGHASIGWTDLGDMSQYGVTAPNPLKEEIKSRLTAYYDNPSVVSRKANEVAFFANTIDYPAYLSAGDVVVAMDGNTVLGIGRANDNGYQFVEGLEFPHTRGVDWLSDATWQIPERENLRTTFREVKKDVNLIEIERHLLHDEKPQPNTTAPLKTPSVRTVNVPPPPITRKIPKTINGILERKKQVILYGPPGTGKTYWAHQTAAEIIARNVYKQSLEQFAANNDDPHAKLAPYIWACTFHPTYGYEDFLEGYRPHTHNDQMTFVLRNGIFKNLCAIAHDDPDHDYILIIDEINRGDIPRIFGELLTLLEKDKRNTTLKLPLSSKAFSVPPNVYIIGTMNTADRSIALLDAALRRRFGFYELMPDISVLGDTTISGIPLAIWLDELNKNIIQHIGADARNLQVGHAYLLENGKPISSMSRFAQVLREDIIPLLEEYSYEDYTLLQKLLGEGLVDLENKRIRYELFESDQREALINELLTPEIITSNAAIRYTVESENEEQDDDITDEDDEA